MWAVRSSRRICWAILLQEFEGEPERIWQSNIFGRSFHELINEDLASKLKHMPEDAREKMQSDPGEDHQRGVGRADLHYSVTR